MVGWLMVLRDRGATIETTSPTTPLTIPKTELGVLVPSAVWILTKDCGERAVAADRHQTRASVESTTKRKAATHWHRDIGPLKHWKIDEISAISSPGNCVQSRI